MRDWGQSAGAGVCGESVADYCAVVNWQTGTGNAAVKVKKHCWTALSRNRKQKEK